MRTTMNIDAVANVAKREDRVVVIAGMVIAQGLHRLGQQLLCLAASFAKPSLRSGASSSVASYWQEHRGGTTSEPMTFATGRGPGDMLGLRPTPATVIAV